MPNKIHAITQSQELIEYAQKLDFGELHIKLDKNSGMQAIIAIHSTKRGPSLGGCRYKRYENSFAAIEDAMRLARGMSYKSAMADLPLGGGKAVIIKNESQTNRNALFSAFANFVEAQNGRYITAVDSGTMPEDMDIISKYTNYVTSLSTGNGDPSPYTAMGVIEAIKAAVNFKLKKENLEGLHIAIQGLGKVGYYLAKELHKLGVKLTITDIDPTNLAQCQKEFNAAIVEPEKIYQVTCDVFAPCALGAVINDETIPQLNTEIIVGSANNQLALPKHGQALFERNVLYGPDYVVNAGGLIYACAQFYKIPKEKVGKQIENIYHSTLNIFKRAMHESSPTSDIADQIAREKIGESK